MRKATVVNIPKLNHIETQSLSGTIGLEIKGIDIRQKLTEAEKKFIHESLLENLVLLFPSQKEVSPKELREFSNLFGTIDEDPFSYPFIMPTDPDFPEIWNIIKEDDDKSVNFGGFWHADVTYRKCPHKVGVIYAKECPAQGGDTMFSNQYLAYETLSDGMKKLLDNLKAKHSNVMLYGGESARFGAVSKKRAASPEDRLFASKTAEQTKVDIVENIHPVVRSHPETGRKSLYVNRGFTQSFAGMTIEESLPLLNFLWEHAARPEFTCRYRWSPNTVGVWDNRCTLHYAVNDYYGAKRHFQRIAIHEESRPN
ncbi:MAG: taurine dioxygenase [Magnetovibrio sp.]|nr:taurine dioxygenase [Magnetovibrio sp.]